MPSIEVTPSPRGVPGAVSDPTRISAEELTFPGAGGDHVNGYLARPADAASHPGMLVVQEAHGLNEHIRAVVDRFAYIGYVARDDGLSPRVVVPPPPGDMQAMMARLFSMSDETVLGYLEGAIEHRRSLDGVSARVGCIGFCMGGRYTLLLACTSAPLRAPRELWG